MPQFLLELFSEEIPARMQKRGAEDLKKLLMDALTKAGFMPTGIETFSAPRRLTAVVEGLPERTADISEERKGPKVGSPEQALAGFLRGAGLSDIGQARIVEDAKKGDYYVADIVKAGLATPDALAAIVPDIIRNFPWPKSMRWGEGALRWVRPLHRIVAVFDGEIVPFDVDGIASGNVTEGHRFHGNGAFSVRDYDDYEAKLTAAHVVLDREERKARIAADARTLCEARNLELVEDIGLLEEVCGLVDEPHVIMGDMDPAFLDLPPEVIRLTLRVNQKYFVVRDPKTGALAPHFIVVSNVAAVDGGVMIAQGNARVLAARLNDARYFWDLDRKTALTKFHKPNDTRYDKLRSLVFHERLGSLTDKMHRIQAAIPLLAEAIGTSLDCLETPHSADAASWAMKADLTTEMVGEFPELQGVMGRYYALDQGLSEDIADAIRDHYKPVGPSDNVPTKPTAIILALADKLDTLVGFFTIDEKPTGSGDPFALRRAALGVLRIIIENKLKFFDLNAVLDNIWTLDAPDGGLDTVWRYYFRHIQLSTAKIDELNLHYGKEGQGGEWALDPDFWDMPRADEIKKEIGSLQGAALSDAREFGRRIAVIPHQLCVPELKDFFKDRLKVELRRMGYSAEHIEIYLGGWLGSRYGYATEVLDSLKATLTPTVQEALTAVARRTWNILSKVRTTIPPEEFTIWFHSQSGFLSNIYQSAADPDFVVIKEMAELVRHEGGADVNQEALFLLLEKLNASKTEIANADFTGNNQQVFINLLSQADWRSGSTAEEELGAIYKNLHQKISDATGANDFDKALKLLIQLEQPLARYFEDVFVEEPGKRMDRLVHLAKAYKLISMVGDFR